MVVELQESYFHLDILLLGCRIQYINPFVLLQAPFCSGNPNNISVMVLNLVLCQTHLVIIDFQKAIAQLDLYLCAAVLL